LIVKKILFFTGMKNENLLIIKNRGSPSFVMKSKRKRGFAALDPEVQREIASKGGRAAHERGTAHQWDSKTARAAGKLGGKSRREKKA